MDRSLRPITHLMQSMPVIAARVGDNLRLLDQVRRELPVELRTRCEGVGLKGSTLVLHVSSSVWANRLRFAQSDLLTRLQKQAVPAERVEIRVLPPSVRTPPAYRPRSLSASSATLLRQVAASLDSPELAQALERLAHHGR